MSGSNVLKRNFSESYSHIRTADRDMGERFEKPFEVFGEDSDREGWMPSSVYSEISFEDFDGVLLGLSSMLNTFLGQGMRANADIERSRESMFQENLGEKFFSEYFEPVSSGRAFRKDIYPGETVELAALSFENGLDVFYPSSFEEHAYSVIQEIKDDDEYGFFTDSDRCFLDDPETYLGVAANDMITDFDEIGERVEVQDEDRDYNEAIFEVAEELEGTTALVTQSGGVTGRAEDYEDVTIQTPELARQYQLHRL